VITSEEIQKLYEELEQIRGDIYRYVVQGGDRGHYVLDAMYPFMKKLKEMI
jgi:hypothetical protein